MSAEKGGKAPPEWPAELVTVALSDVRLHPRNPRRSDMRLLRESMRSGGFLSPIVVQRSTGYVLAGNGRVRAAMDLGVTHAPALIVDLPDDVARRYMLADNKTSDEAVYDPVRLAKVLASLPGEAEDALAGTAYTQPEVDIIAHRAAWHQEDAPAYDDEAVDEMPGRMVFGRLARRTLPLSIPVTVHAAFTAALQDARDRHETATNEELLAHYLVSDGLLPETFSVFGTADS